MFILDRYIFSQWFKIFFGAMFVTLGILILHDAYSDLPDLISYGANAATIIKYYALKLPSYIPVVLPISLLLSIIFSLGTLHRNSEIIAMRAAGLTIWRISRPLWAAGICLSILLFYLNADIVPKAVQAGRADIEALRLAGERKAHKTSNNDIINHLSFNNRKNSRIWFVREFVKSTNEAKGVEVHVLDSQSRETHAVRAKYGFYNNSDKCWTFKDGFEVFFDAQTSNAKRTLKFREKTFKDFGEDPDIMELTIKRPKDLSVLELRHLIDVLGEEKEMLPYSVQLQSMLTSPFVCLIVVAIAIPFSVAGVRTNPMVGVSKTVGLFFAYYLLTNIFTAVGSKDLLTPAMAAWIPNIIMMLWALSLYRKAV